eukprot:109229-Prymnesium_polylepis.1
MVHVWRVRRKAVATRGRAPLERSTENGERRTENGDGPKAGARALDPRPQDENREQRTGSGTGPQLVGCANLSHIRPTASAQSRCRCQSAAHHLTIISRSTTIRLTSGNDKPLSTPSA